jgi:biopolymer transport protein ExbB
METSMREILNRKSWALAGLCAAVMGVAAPALAQGASSSSAFTKFFWSNDVFGLIIIYLLIAMSICVMALSLRAIQVNKAGVVMPREAVDAYAELLNAKRFREALDRSAEDPTMFGKVMHATLNEASGGFASMRRAIDEHADLMGSERIRKIEKLNVLGAVGPMIGLFGTVYGMIVAFQTIVDVGGQPEPAQLADGISTALVTTIWGLVVGIPAVATGALMRTKIEGLMVAVIVQAEELIVPFRSAGGGGGKKSASKDSGGAGGGGAAPKPRPS